MDEEKPKKKRKKAAAEGEGGEPKEHKPNWREVYATVEDIKGFLADHIYLRHNVITRRAECRIPQADYFAAGWSGGQCTDQWQPISDRVVNSLWTEMSKLKPTRAPDIYRVIESDFVPDYHPFRYYLDHLPPWDGQDYIIELSLSVSIRGGVEKQMLFYEYLKKWLVAMVAGWVDETVVNHVMLVLIGEQGSYKTTWFNYLLPPELKTYFYTKTNANRMGRDDLLTLAQYGLVCCEELDTMRPSELNQLKAVLTMPSIDERAAYAHFHEHRQHIASFCGTGNNVQFLSDETGNRRWLPFARRPMRSIRRASTTGSPRTTSAASPSTTVPSRRRAWRPSSCSSTSVSRRKRSRENSCLWPERCRSSVRTSRRSCRQSIWAVPLPIRASDV